MCGWLEELLKPALFSAEGERKCSKAVRYNEILIGSMKLTEWWIAELGTVTPTSSMGFQ